jgi:hypothetical protein
VDAAAVTRTHARTSRGHFGKLSTALDRLDQRRGATHAHLAGSLRQAQYGARQARPAMGRDTQERHEVTSTGSVRRSTGSTSDGARHTGTSRGLDRLDQRWGATHRNVARSRQARPAMGRDTQARRDVTSTSSVRRSTGSTNAGARHTRTSRGHFDRLSTALDRLDQRRGATHAHVVGSLRQAQYGARQARPALGRDPHERSDDPGREPGATLPSAVGD